jgi:eukaryotic-like serine/threonine-protein kinase
MDPVRWQRMQDLFERASSLDPDQRSSYLDSLSRDDPTLRDDVESLLRAADQAGQFIDSAISGAAATGGASPLSPGARVGRYRIVSEIGRGGMGAVFLAERADDEFRQRVALKVVREAELRPDLPRRLRAERQILARLAHPNIAMLLDGGTTDEGTPYFVMEYVDGLPIDRYADLHRLDVPARLALIRRVADAVQHANRNLVIHRDLKPSNILVTANGTPKLLDFGIAKLLAADPDVDSALTRTAVRLLTPAYASPEQILGDAVSAGTDVYSLGVVCYELLTGRLPYPGARHNLRDLERAVVEAEPIAPSRAVTQPSEDAPPPPDVAARRRTTVERLRRTLSGDLDVILGTALRKDPERRYRTAADFADDLGRHLEGRPVAARPDTVGYRVGKFVGRHRLAATATLVALVVGGASIAFSGARLARERDRAVASAQRAEAVSTFLTNLFRLANPEETDGRALTAQDLLNRGVGDLDRELAGRPLLQATMLNTIAQAYIKLGRSDSAKRLLDRALTLREEALGPNDPEVARTLLVSGELDYEQGRYDSSLAKLQRAVTIQRATLAPNDTALALGLNDLGWIEYEFGHLAVAESLTRRALAIRTERHGLHHLETAESQNNLAVVLQAEGRTAEAEPLYRAALATREVESGPNSPITGFTANNLAALLEANDDLAPAESLYRRSLAVSEAAFGHDNPRVSTSLVNLGRLLGRLERWEEAEGYLQRALAIDRGVGENHPYTAYDLRTLGDLMRTKGDLPAAERYYRQALAIYGRLGSEGEVSTGSVLRGLALLHLERGEAAPAESLLRRAIALWTGQIPPEQLDFQHLRALLGESLADLGRYAEAESLLVASRITLVASLPADDPRRARARAALTRVLVATDRAADTTGLREP